MQKRREQKNMVPFSKKKNLDNSILKSSRLVLGMDLEKGEKNDKKEQVAGTNSLVGNEEKRETSFGP